MALGNTGTQADLGSLERAAMDPDPLISEHATWAVERVQQREVIDTVGPVGM